MKLTPGVTARSHMLGICLFGPVGLQRRAMQAGSIKLKATGTSCLFFFILAFVALASKD